MADGGAGSDPEVVECSACFGEVNPDATRCRYCGASFEPPPWWRTRWGTTLIGAAIGLVIAVVVVGRAQDNADRRADECVDAIATPGSLDDDEAC
jgi:hypothetical protein